MIWVLTADPQSTNSMKYRSSSCSSVEGKASRLSGFLDKRQGEKEKEGQERRSGKEESRRKGEGRRREREKEKKIKRKPDTSYSPTFSKLFFFIG